MKIAVISGSRADYNLLKYINLELSKRKKFNVFSYCINNRYSNGELVNIVLKNYELNVIFKFKEILSNKFDYIIVMGDRIEILLISIIAKQKGIKIIHLGGGETSQGSNDEYFRYCISRLSDYHLVISEQSKNNLLNAGIKDNIFVVGSPRIDYMFYEKLIDKKELFEYFKFDINKKTALIIIHPEKKKLKLESLFKRLKTMNYNLLFLSANYDEGYEEINEQIIKNGFKITTDLDIKYWYSLYTYVDLVIGNSSSFIMEAPFYNCKIELIGERQKGREEMNLKKENVSKKVVKLLEKIL